MRGACPATTALLWDEITLHGQRKPPSDLPQRLDHLSNALLAMTLAGLVEERGGEWYVLPQRVREPERTLF